MRGAALLLLQMQLLPQKLCKEAAAATATAAAAAAVHWIFKNRDHGKTSATASLGLVCLWDVEGGLPLIDKYLYASDSAVVAGALLAIGLVSCGVQNENDPGALACAW